MKTKLFTQKLFLGLLMGLVLALGVQSIADAVSDPAPTAQTNADIITNRLVGSPFDVADLTLTGEKAGTTESVTITISSGITLSEPVHSTGSVTLREKEVADSEPDTPGNQPANGPFIYKNDSLSGSVDVIGHFTSAGKKTITIKGTAYDGSGDATAWSHTFIYYVTAPTPDREKAFKLQSLTDGYYKKGNFDRASIKIHSASGHFPVTYTVSGTGATLKAEYPSGGRETFTSPISSALNVYLEMGSATAVVTAKVSGSDVTTRGTYIYGFPTLTVAHPGDPNGDGDTSDATTGSKGDRANINSTISKAFTVTVNDGVSTPGDVSDVVVKFQAKGSGDAGGYLVFDSSRDTTPDVGILVGSNDNRQLSRQAGSDKILYVRTTSDGEASVSFEFGTAEKQDITISTVGITRTFSVYTKSPDAGPQFTEQSSTLRAGKYDLRATVTDNGVPQFNRLVEFTTRDGTLITPATGDETDSNDILPAMTNQRGEVFVIFDPSERSNSPRVIANLIQPADTTATPATPRRILDTITFDVRGGSSTPQPPTPPVQQRNRLTISTTGEGTTRSVTVNALTTTNAPISGLSVVLSGTALTTAQTVTTGTAVSITLPSTSGDYTLIATDPNGTFDTGTVTVTVSAPGTLEMTLGTRTGNQQPITVRAVRGGSAQSAVNITITGGATSVSRQTDSSGRASAIVTLPTATGAHTLTVRATGGYDPAQITVPAVTGESTRDPSEPTTTRGTAGVADSIQISGQVFRTGTVNTQLDLPLSVRVLDGNGRGVEDVRVTFRLQTGQGRLSQRGNGRATAIDTDRNGYARAPYTPLARGTSTVRVKAASVTQTVTFTITVNGASDPETNTGADDTPRVTDDTPRSREINPVVQVNAQNRPPMLWVDSGKIYALVGAEVQAFISGVEGAMNIAIGDDRVYWTERTGESAGTINSVNLNGSDAKQLASIQAVPMGIAVDTIRSKLYWTNSRGRIQAANLDGSRIQNVIQGSSNRLIDLLLSGNNLYFTQSDESGPIGRIDPTLSGEQMAFWDDSSMPGTPGSLAIANGKLYWTAKTGESSGTINSVNLNGSDAKQLASIQAVPMGIAVDTIRSKLYWTNSRGRVQSANLNGSGIRNVVTGLGMPGDMVLSNSIKAPTEAPEKSTTIAAGKSKYDINGDGSVDDKDVDMLLLAVLSELTAAKYDVNGDGSVDAKDVREVNKNLDKAAAGAPALLGRKFSAIQRDRLQAQIDLLVASNDRSPATLKTLVYLQQLLATARPEKTQLLANYPNPFNPETWMPYQLATDTDVKITIYNAQGVVIRVLHLGQQSAGYYTDRERAAYWDGRNALGEQVASGIYFYQLETDDMSSLRKMVILK